MSSASGSRSLPTSPPGDDHPSTFASGVDSSVDAGKSRFIPASKSVTAPAGTIVATPAGGAGPTDEEEDGDQVSSSLARRITLGRNWKISHKGSIRRKPAHSNPEPSSASSIATASSSTATAASADGDTVVEADEEDQSRSRSESSPAQLDAYLSLEAAVPVAEPPPKSLAELGEEKRLKYVQVRKHIIGELLQTERNYVSNLEMVISKFKYPLVRAIHGEKFTGVMSSSSAALPSPGSKMSASADFGSRVLERSPSIGGSSAKSVIIPAVDIKILFAYIEDLWDFSKDFCQSLEEVASNWDTSETIWEAAIKDPSKLIEGTFSIGQLFNHEIRNWGLYLKFVDNYSSAKEAIRRSEENSANYRLFIAESLKDKDFQRQGLVDFLILPIQRVTRYVLLLQDLKKHTPLDHPEYTNILSALDDMRKLANTVNEVKRREEEMTRMFHVVRNVEDVPPTLISAQRRIAFESESVDVTKDYQYLALQPIASGENNVSIIPSLAWVQSSDAANTDTKIYVFSDLLMIAKRRGKKKKDGALSKYLSGSGDGAKKEKYSLFRMAWFKDIEFVNVVNESEEGETATANTGVIGTMVNNNKASGTKHLLRIIIYNSEGGNPTSRRKFWGELAQANTAAVSAATIGPRSSSKKARSIDESSRVPSMLSMSPTVSEYPQASSAPTSPVQAADVIKRSDADSPDVNPDIPINTEVLEKLKLDRVTSPLEQEVTSAEPDIVAPIPVNVHKELPAIPTVRPTNLHRAATVTSRSPAPRTSSLTPNPSSTMSSILKQQLMEAENPNGAVAKRGASLAEEVETSQLSLASTTESRRTSKSDAPFPEGGPETTQTGSTLQRKASILSQTGFKEEIVESFIFEFADKKAKNELMLVMEKMLSEKSLSTT